MAGFFSLGSGSGSGRGNKEEDEEREREVDNNNNNSNNKFLFRNEEIYSRGFEIWPQQQQTFNNSNNYYSFGVAAGPSRRNVNDNDVNDDVSVSFSDTNDSHRFGFTVMRPGGGGGSGGIGGGGGGMNCQDCGNQAKKDCPHLRCRTCCKSRGFHCQTHVKSTWVPAAKRRERLQQLTALQQQQQQPPPPLPQPQHLPSRRHRENQNQASGSGSGTALACAPLPITTTGLELGQFPPELNSPAVFRCVKVSAMDAQDERYAYQTAVNIGGHVFKGILYDQGVDGPYNSSTAAGEGSGGGGSGEHPQNLITAGAATTSGGNNPFEYSSLYPAPLNAFMAGTQFFPPPRS